MSILDHSRISESFTTQMNQRVNNMKLFLKKIMFLLLLEIQFFKQNLLYYIVEDKIFIKLIFY